MKRRRCRSVTEEELLRFLASSEGRDDGPRQSRFVRRFAAKVRRVLPPLEGVDDQARPPRRPPDDRPKGTR